MLLFLNDFRKVFWFAVLPAIISVSLLLFGFREQVAPQVTRRANPISKANLRRLSTPYWWVVGIGAAFTLARFSEAFLVLRAQQSGVPIALVPMVMVLMNIIYAGSAYPFGKLSDKMSHAKLLALGLVVLLFADFLLAINGGWATVLAGVALWGVHLGVTQGLLATMVAATAPEDLRGTAFGLFNLACGAALLLGSAFAGLLWDVFGASITYYTGAFLCVAALLVLAKRP
jgi:predicted MFS family arabinose efflux permease